MTTKPLDLPKTAVIPHAYIEQTIKNLAAIQRHINDEAVVQMLTVEIQRLTRLLV